MNPLAAHLHRRQVFGHKHGGGGGGFGFGGDRGGRPGIGGGDSEDNDDPTAADAASAQDGASEGGGGEGIGKLASGMMDAIEGVCGLRKDLMSVQESLPDLSSLTELLGKRQGKTAAAEGDGALDGIGSLFSGLMDALDGACNLKSDVSSFAESKTQ